MTTNGSPKHIKKDIVNFDTESALVSLEKKNSYLLEVNYCIFLKIYPTFKEIMPIITNKP
jgi:hypothetical protein